MEQQLKLLLALQLKKNIIDLLNQNLSREDFLIVVDFALYIKL